MLSPLDDYPIHQVPQPVRRVATSDRNFYDRYYFNCMPAPPTSAATPGGGGPVAGSDDTPFLVMGMGQYPNLGTADAYAVLVHRGTHRVVRASRALGVDRMDTTVGPFSVDVVEGLQTLRFRLYETGTDTGETTSLSFDLTWEGAEAPIEEPRHTDRDAVGRVFLDACRLAQTGTWTGEIRVGDESWTIGDGNRWWGSRDRSWGIRPSGESEPPGITATLPGTGFNWLYTPARFEDQSVFIICQHRNDGSRVLEEAVRVWRTSSGEGIEHLGRPEYELEWAEAGGPTADGRVVARATIRAGNLVMEATPRTSVSLGVGTGYGFDPEWRHGKYLGDLVVQERRWDLTTAEGRAAMWGIIDASATYTLDGEVGHGLLEYLFL